MTFFLIASAIVSLGSIVWALCEMCVAAYWQDRSRQWQRAAEEAATLAIALHGRQKAARQLRSARARYARQCQLDQQRAKVQAKAAELRGER